MSDLSLCKNKITVKTVDQVMYRIIEWMYLNDRGFQSGAEWRKKFLEMVKREVEELAKQNDSGGGMIDVGNKFVSIEECKDDLFLLRIEESGVTNMLSREEMIALVTICSSPELQKLK